MVATAGGATSQPIALKRLAAHCVQASTALSSTDAPGRVERPGVRSHTSQSASGGRGDGERRREIPRVG